MTDPVISVIFEHVPIFFSKNRRVTRESIPTKNPWRRQANFAAFSFGCRHTIQPLISRSAKINIIFGTFLLLQPPLVPNLFPQIQVAQGILDWCHAKSVRTLNSNLKFGEETWLGHRRHLPKQRGLCAVHRTSNQDRLMNFGRASVPRFNRRDCVADTRSLDCSSWRLASAGTRLTPPELQKCFAPNCNLLPMHCHLLP